MKLNNDLGLEIEMPVKSLRPPPRAQRIEEGLVSAEGKLTSSQLDNIAVPNIDEKSTEFSWSTLFTFGQSTGVEKSDSTVVEKSEIASMDSVDTTGDLVQLLHVHDFGWW